MNNIHLFIDGQGGTQWAPIMLVAKPPLPLMGTWSPPKEHSKLLALFQEEI